MSKAVAGTTLEPADFIEKGTPQFLHTSLALFAGGFATFALLYCVQPLMPVMSRDFGLNAAQSSLVLSISTIMLAIGLLFTGPLSDALGRKPVMVVSLMSAALFTVLGTLVPNWEGLLVTRALLGLSLSGLVAVAMTYLGEEMDPRFLGVAMGLYIGGNAIGGMGGRLIVGVLVDFVDWRIAVGALGMIALIAATLFWRVLPESRHFQASPLNLRTIIGNFALHMRDAGLPWLYLEAFLLMGGFVTLYNYIGYRLLDGPYNLSQALVGLLSVVYLSGICSSAWAGSLADRLGRRKVFWASVSLMLAGLLVTLLPQLPVILLGMVAFTFGFFAAHSVASSWIGRRALTAKGQASSLYMFSYYLGSSVAGTVGGVFWHNFGWLGVGLFIAALLALALAVALHLSRLPAKVNPQ
ncbi:MFS transporter [Pseudomonas sp. LRF_L74]|uniref:MFS transporter n=1 Tax=Pseudomonas sp. LRF_L74 TaxID=3369422 RepID=UPI003F5F7C59